MRSILPIFFIFFSIVNLTYSESVKWANGISSNADDHGISTVTDNVGNVYVCGNFYGSNLIFCQQHLQNQGGYDIYITKFDSSGICIWTTKIAGNSDDYVYSMAIDNSNNIYVSGNYSSDQLIFNNNKTLSGNGTEAFIAKYSSDGLCQWANKIGGNSQEVASKVKVDNSGNVYVTGKFFGSSVIFNNGKFVTGNNDVYPDAFLCKYDNNGVCQWAQGLLGNMSDEIYGLSLDGNLNVYLSGEFDSDTLYLNNNKKLPKGEFISKIFIAKYDSQGLCQDAWQFGGTGIEYSNDILFVDNSNIFLAGTSTGSTLFFGDESIFTSIDFTGKYHGYLISLNSTGFVKWGVSLTNAKVNEIKYDNGSSIYLAGAYENTASFDIYSLTNNSDKKITALVSDIDQGFLTRYDFDGKCIWAQGPSSSQESKFNSLSVSGTKNIYVTGSFKLGTLNFGKSIINGEQISLENTDLLAYDGILAKYYYVNPPSITTQSTILEMKNAYFTTIINDNGGSFPTTSGICWSNQANPTINNSKTTDNIITNVGGLDYFNSHITGLYPGITYFARAYVVNEAGIAYSNQVEFLTPSDESNFQQLSFQGILKNSSGEVLQSGNYDFTFRIYNQSQGGLLLWSETKTITINSGIINTELGDVNKINLPFNTSYWLGIQISPDSNELSPRRKLTGPIYKNGGFGR